MVKKVLSICSIEPTRLGSFEEFIIAFTKKLTESGYEHVVAVVNKPIDLVYSKLISSGAKIISFSETNSTYENTLTFVKLIKQFSPSLVHFHFFPTPYQPINLYCHLNNTPVVYTEHFSPNKPGKKLLKHGLKRVYYGILAQLFNIGIYKIICVSKFIEENHELYYHVKPGKLITIYNGLNLDRFNSISKANQKNNPVVICIAGLTERKGVQYLIKAAPLIIDQVSDVIFFIVGDGPYFDVLKDMVSDMNLEKYFVFTGYRNDVEQFLSMSNVSVVPSVCYEALSFAAMESLALSVPVVASNIGGLKEVIEHEKTGFLVPPEDSDAIAKQVIELIKNPDIATKYGLEGKNKIEQLFPQEKAVMKYIKIYEDIL
ncbi:glycosyltransferase family 4 protein [Methanolobus sp. ZRKC3]|uniref:glycosyltransferase family 4 protein n=1 Tax=Methanolobus sp. ZRKC3 TaxID=3125786 RepID=UPI00324E3570